MFVNLRLVAICLFVCSQRLVVPGYYYYYKNNLKIMNLKRGAGIDHCHKK